MTPMENDSLYRRVKRVLFGAPRDLFDPKIFHNVSLIAFFAWVGLGADGISSSCYGPEEAYLALGSHAVLAIFVAVMSVATIFIISGSYAQIIEAFPSGGGGYIVASKLLGERAGVVSGSALVIDYVLTITISIASGADALFSILPHQYLPYKIWFVTAVILIAHLDEPAGDQGVRRRLHSHLHGLHAHPHPAPPLRDAPPCSRDARSGRRRVPRFPHRRGADGMGRTRRRC